MKELAAPKKIVFITGTRADFGKLKSLLSILKDEGKYELHVFVTGMHMLAKYGYTCQEVENCKFGNLYKFINQNQDDSMDSVLAKTVAGLSDYVKEIGPDLIVVHGDRVETLAGAIVGSLNNILVAHIEGGEVSGTIDELIRHAVTKLSHLHFVANEKAKQRLRQLGECPSSIFVIGSPDIDVMASKDLPTFEDVRERYDLNERPFGIAIFHPVTTELDRIEEYAKAMVAFLIEDDLDYVVIYPNNDPGASLILDQYKRLQGVQRIRIFPSMRFEYFLTLMKNAQLLVGNSSAGMREAPFFGVPSVNLGSRQHNRAFGPTIVHSDFNLQNIRQAVATAKSLSRKPTSQFGKGDSSLQFLKTLALPDFWQRSRQKYFNDIFKA